MRDVICQLKKISLVQDEGEQKTSLIVPTSSLSEQFSKYLGGNSPKSYHAFYYTKFSKFIKMLCEVLFKVQFLCLFLCFITINCLYRIFSMHVFTQMDLMKTMESFKSNS